MNKSVGVQDLCLALESTEFCAFLAEEEHLSWNRVWWHIFCSYQVRWVIWNFPHPYKLLNDKNIFSWSLTHFLPQHKFSPSLKGLRILTASSACLLYDFTFACNLSTRSCSLRTFLRSSSVWEFEKTICIQYNEITTTAGKINHFAVMAGGPGVNLVHAEASILLTVVILVKCPLCAGTVLGN